MLALFALLPVVALQTGGRRQPASKSNKRADSDEEDVKPPFFMAKVEKKSPSRFKKWQVRVVASSMFMCSVCLIV